MPKAKSAPNVLIVAELAAAQKALAPAVRRLEKALNKALDLDKLPPGACVDLLYDLRAVDKVLNTLRSPFDDVLDPAIKALEENFIQTLAVGESSGVQGMRSRVQVTESVVPTVKPEDWEKVWAWVARTKAWELLPRSLKADAVRERWAAKKNIPGVTPYHAKKVSCTKLGGK